MTICRLCKESETELVINFGRHPISRFTSSEVYPIELMWCKNCGFLQLDKYIAPEVLYSNQQINLSSWKNQPQLPRILQIIRNLKTIDCHSRVLEVGSNDGSFLNELAQIKFRHLYGIDPCNPIFKSDRIKYYQEFFNLHFVQNFDKFDLIIARHVLEHIENLQDFGKALKHLCRLGTYVLIEVPDFGFHMQYSDYSGVWEEHTNYFTLLTLKQYLSQFGIEIVFTERFAYSGQSLLAVCRYNNCDISKEKDALYSIAAYQNNWLPYCKRLHSRLSKLKEGIVLYGAGCRGISLINYTNIAKYLSFVVDDQPEKQGRVLPASGLSVFPSETMYDGQVNTCLLAVNTENEQSVLERHKKFNGQIFSLLHPSKMILGI